MEPVSYATIETVCNWLGVPVSYVVDTKTDSVEILRQIATVLAISPELADVFSEIADRVIDGEIDQQILAEVAAFAAFRLNIHSQGDTNAQDSNAPGSQEVLHEDRVDSERGE